MALTISKIIAEMKRRGMKPYVAKHPRTGKWWAIDRVLRSPVGRECNTKSEAEKEWYLFNASMIGDIATRDYSISNPSPSVVEIYSDIQAIDAVKGRNSLWPREHFRHKFKPGSRVYGLPNGDILIHSTKGRRLWRKFKYPD